VITNLCSAKPEFQYVNLRGFHRQIYLIKDSIMRFIIPKFQYIILKRRKTNNLLELLYDKYP